MNYDHFERLVLGYEAGIRCRAERRLMLRGAGASAPASRRGAGAPLRAHVAAALRALANHVEAQPVSC